MKKIINSLMCFSVVGCLLLLGCGKVSRGVEDPVSRPSGSLRVSATYNLDPDSSASVSSLDDMIVTSGNVVLTHDDTVYTFPLTIGSGSSYAEINNLQVGEWSLTLALYNSHSTVLYSGTATASITVDDVTETSVLISAVRGALAVFSAVPNIKTSGTEGGVFILKADGSLWAIGNNASGEFGTGDTDDIATWTKVLDDVVDIDCGRFHCAALKTSGTVWESGTGITGGPGWTSTFYGAKSIEAGPYATFAIRNDNTLWGRGSNSVSQLGLDTAGEPVAYFTELMANVKKVVSAASNTMVLNRNGTVYVTGSNLYGALGSATERFYTWSGVATDVEDIALGEGFGLIMKEDGVVYGAGIASYIGYSGVGSFDHVTSWTQVMTGAESIYAISLSAYVLRADGNLYASGISQSGLLGMTGITNTQQSWMLTATSVYKFFPGSSAAIFQKADNTLWLSGENYFKRAVPTAASDLLMTWAKIPE